MNLYSVVFATSLAGTPVLLGVCWWLRDAKQQSSNVGWRKVTLLVGLACASINALIYFSWLAGRLLFNNNPMVWQTKDICGDVGIPLVAIALLAAILGKGVSRVPLAISALLGFILWIPVGIL